MTTDPQANIPPRGWLRRLTAYCWAHPRLVVIAGSASIGGALISAAVPLVIRHVIDELLAKTGIDVWAWSGALVVVALVQYALTFTRRISAARLAFGVQFDLRRDLFAALTRLDGVGQDSLDTGQVVSRSVTDLAVVGGLLAFVPMVASNLLLFVISLGVMVVLSPVMTIVALAVAPGLWLVSRGSRRDLFPANWDAAQRAGELAGHVEAAVTGVRVVKGFGQEDRELANVEDQARGLFASRLRAVRLAAKYAPALAAIPALGQVGVLLLGGWLALHGSITLGTFLAFSTYLAQLVSPVRLLAELLTVGPQARASVERVVDIIDAFPGITDAPDAVDLPAGPLGIDFDDVHFGYDASEVLSGLTLHVAPGETVAIVGGAGSGKSTLLQLIGRFYDADRPAESSTESAATGTATTTARASHSVNAGTVRVGGVDVRRLRAASLRGSTGYVFEESFLFSDTVGANIAYGRPDAGLEEITAAARAAEADGFIQALPLGYDTVIGERGLTLSGGQRQRIAIARALLAQPRVLILDDATSAVDPRVEARINARLRATAGGRTTLLVAHRRSSLEVADRVVVLEAGRVAASGTVDELLATSPLFRRLFFPSEADGAAAQVSAQHGRRPAWSSSAGPSRPNGTGRAAFAGGAGIAAVAAATPDLLAQVAALPPAAGDPHISDAVARSADPQFGLVRLTRPVRRGLLIGLALVGVDALAQLVVPAVVRSGIDQGVSRGSLSTLVALSAFAFVVVLGDWAVSRAGQLVTGRTGERLLFLLRVKTFAHLQRLGLDYYERELGGRIMTRMTTDVDALSTFLQTGLTTMFVSLLTLLGVLIALIVLDGALALVLVAMVPILVVATLIFRRYAVPAYTDAREKISIVNAGLQENVAGLRVTQAYCRQGYNRDRFLTQSRDYVDSRMRAQRYIATYFPFVSLLSDVAGALVLGFGAQRLQSGTLTAGALIAFFLYLDAFFGPVQQLSQVFDSYQQASVGLARLRDLLRTATTTPQSAHPVAVPRLRGEIVLRDVSFRYVGAETDAVQNLRLRIDAGETVALVGETGAGKSTVVKLVTRFYDPTGGAVLLDGRDLRDFDIGAYRRRLGLVPQEPYLSSGTVADAIAYGRPDAAAADIVAAARSVGADEAIEALPGGYQHQVGERGRNLSAGQRQLVALARAELVQPDILLLDEATAALDLASEAVVARATQRLTRRRTTIVVAHRLTTAARADRIVVMDGGRIVEIGTHEQLLDAGGTYAELWASYADRAIESAAPPGA